ncbi:mitochondrial ATP synthase g subunit-domain-containing protein, partial [Triangularia verruculosa]
APFYSQLRDIVFRSLEATTTNHENPPTVNGRHHTRSPNPDFSFASPGRRSTSHPLNWPSLHPRAVVHSHRSAEPPDTRISPFFSHSSPHKMSFALLSRRSALTMGRQMVRFESTASQKAAETAKQTATKAQAQAAELSSKAQEGLSRVTAAAGPAITNAAKNVSGALSKVGGPTGRLVAFVESKTPTLVYYTKVGIEVAKIVFRGQSMSPPSVSTFQTYFQNLWKQLQTPGVFFSQLAKSLNPQQVRNLSRTQVAAGGVLLAELLGFFTVGEMIGRLKIVGYRGGQKADAHH